MSGNIKNYFSHILLKQRGKSRKISRAEAHKRAGKGGALYDQISSENSYKKMKSVANGFGDFCREKHVRKPADITPEFAESYVRERYQNGLSTKTLQADCHAINHLMVGGGFWSENQRISCSKMGDIPRNRNSQFYGRYKRETADEWRSNHEREYARYRAEIDTMRAFGFRRKEIIGDRTRENTQFGTNSLFERGNHLYAVVQGKGGRWRETRCRSDLEPEMRRLYGDYVRPASEIPKSTIDYDRMEHHNRPFYDHLSHSVPSHIWRTDYAEHMSDELARDPACSKGTVTLRVHTHVDGVQTRVTRDIPASRPLKIGSHSGTYGSMKRLSEYMGHNRLDVLHSYLGAGN